MKCDPCPYGYPADHEAENCPHKDGCDGDICLCNTIGPISVRLRYEPKGLIKFDGVTCQDQRTLSEEEWREGMDLAKRYGVRQDQEENKSD